LSSLYSSGSADEHTPWLIRMATSVVLWNAMVVHVGHVGHVVNRVALGQDFPRFSAASCYSTSAP
jgi:hypothetical protein